MKRRIGRRLVSLLLTFVTILTLLPAMTLPALAKKQGNLGGLTNTDIELEFDGNKNDPWTVGGTKIEGSMQSTSGIFGITSYYHSTLTIRNKKGTKATLSFKYTVAVNEGTINVGDLSSVTENGTFSTELAKDASIKVYIKSGSTDAPTKITMTDVNLVADATATVTFLPTEKGSYTVDGKPVTEECTKTQSSTTPYQVVATPEPGYQFMDWYDVNNKKSISRLRETELNIEKDCTIKARFTTSGSALFETGGLVYDDLTNAITAVSGKPSALITQVGDGTVSGSYTIPKDVTLLIPFNEAGTLYTTVPAYTEKGETPKAYRTLTMVDGSSIKVDGAISVGGKHFAGSGSSCCKATGQYGQIIMQEGSSITLNNGANLYAWGYITGDGEITANSGATVYEYFQVMDWRGGVAVSKLIGNDEKVFPFSQYYVQNIEAPLTIKYGATEKAYFNVIAGGKAFPTTIDFIGTHGLFNLEFGSITKKYVPATGRTEYTTNGTASLEHLAVTMKLGFTYTIDSMDYALPINGNMTLNIASGKVTSNYDLCLLPGVQINIAKDAELVVAKTASLYVYDSAEWGDYCQCKNKKFADVDYSPTPGRHTRTEADLVDAKIDLNGKLTAIGSVYTTDSGANICSSEGGGRFVQQNAPGQEKTTHQVKKQADSLTGRTEYYDIPITPAKLHNADNSYTGTAGSSAGATFTYCTCTTCGGGKWTNGLQVAEIGATKYDTLQKAVTDVKDNQYIKLLHNTTEKTISVNNKNLRLDLNGRTVTGDISVTGNHKLYGMDSTAGKDYTTAPSGKIVGTVTGTVAPVFEKTLTGDDEYNYLRYVAIKNEADKEYSFHRFNISVTGYRFELAAPECALFFIGKFQGDKAAKDHLTELGFTLKVKGENDEKDTLLGEDNYKLPSNKNDIPDMPAGGEASDSKVVCSGDAYLFEAYLKRSFNKENRNGYTEEIGATAQAKFDNGGTQESTTQHLSFKDAWTEPEGYKNLTPKQQEILNRFLTELDIPIPKLTE